MKNSVLLTVFVLLSILIPPVHAEDQINYISQPDEMVVFLNDIAYVRDTLRIPGDAEARIVLPAQVYQDTLIVRQGDMRVPEYRISSTSGSIILLIGATENADLRSVTLEYLTAGASWKPSYDMAFSEGEAESVDFHFFAELRNDIFALDGVDVKLAAGNVSTSQQIGAASTVTMNQYITGYQDDSSAALAQGAVTLQYLYPLEKPISAEAGETLYMQLLGTTLPARRLLLWNASSDKQVTVIYKVENTSDVPLSEGIVRSYQDGLFVGSDFIEFTPLGAEGSVTVGGLQDVRVNRTDTTTYNDRLNYERQTLHAITLTMRNFTQNPLDLEVVESYPVGGLEFEYSAQPEVEAGNRLRWQMTIPANGTLEITYSYRASS
ncbi:MAG: DUF4139 domain-containing protein [Chloroflexota bacterium]